ncbi:unnamed protein product [Xylocopa violacea]|uniref:Secreted protein n=1 Tax=Xylocopa violacea TaxID=135666 RepID=A0ABP1N7K2_XYLVO
MQIITKLGRPLFILKTSLLAGSSQHSASAPTTFACTSSSSCSSRNGTKDATRLLRLNLSTFSRLMAHFHIPPVTAANSCLLARTSSLCRSWHSTSRPYDSRTMSLATLFDPHLNIARAQFSFSLMLSLCKCRTTSNTMSVCSNASRNAFCERVYLKTCALLNSSHHGHHQRSVTRF